VTSIVTSIWAVIPNDGTLVLSGQAVAGAVTTVRLSGGTPGVSYAIRNIVTVSGPNGLDTYAVSVRQDITW
jgi:hypothetical protein